jgi:hypothetical protein
MAIIRRVFGPFHPEEHLDRQDPELRWSFNGIRGDKTMAHWVLVFLPKKRKWTASNISIKDTLVGRSRIGLDKQGISPDVKEEAAHPDAWLDDRPVMEGTVTDILKKHLRPDDIARATALSITRR